MFSVDSNFHYQTGKGGLEFFFPFVLIRGLQRWLLSLRLLGLRRDMLSCSGKCLCFVKFPKVNNKLPRHHDIYLGHFN